MQSLVLISSLVLNTPVSISSLSDTQDLNKLINEQVSTVQKQVRHNTQLSILDTDILQARHIVKLVKSASSTNNEASE
ncbi:hypothetical protein [Psychrosphaera aestuarii]|uniref:hypothetical protein n=1 Tax=Psychrosphaera aestuarii TaxID=1266052 RepID=UPI001B33EBFD|nr:hypothetical protein [Psychrosphaera aestuarii]